MRQVFLNIVTNAADAMPEGGTLTVKTGLMPDKEHVKVTFSDTGCGISEENLGKLFTPFFTTKQLGKGTGLGLSIAYGIVKMHRGQIEAQSTLGAGTTFTIGLPLQVPSTAGSIG
jgi:two-component system NtrC family sensor kinase